MNHSSIPASPFSTRGPSHTGATTLGTWVRFSHSLWTPRAGLKKAPRCVGVVLSSSLGHTGLTDGRGPEEKGKASQSWQPLARASEVVKGPEEQRIAEASGSGVQGARMLACGGNKGL